ncbi:hypothetical protein TI39_contig4570g00001 [Zymoseptoria brevis]|uniref:Ig-like domain-containing protein n=1 Tax=Zymoseptoria brevis TaxID=1047168 RepID=A0A0F4G6F0_9PEZI|nr:hypothetical protein TI39_contig4570g00001 [Zymoseptoria brevis]
MSRYPRISRVNLTCPICPLTHGFPELMLRTICMRIKNIGMPPNASNYQHDGTKIEREIDRRIRETHRTPAECPNHEGVIPGSWSPASPHPDVRPAPNGKGGRLESQPRPWIDAEHLYKYNGIAAASSHFLLYNWEHTDQWDRCTTVPSLRHLRQSMEHERTREGEAMRFGCKAGATLARSQPVLYSEWLR